MQRKYIQIIVLIGILGCNSNSKYDYEKIFKENSNTFEFQKPKLNSIIVDLKNCCINNWNRQKELNVEIKNLNKQTQQYIKELGVDGINVNINPNDSCKINYVISMNIIKGWNIDALKFVQIRYAPCNKFTEKNYHFYDGYHVDFWGQGESWYIASDTDWL